MDDISNIRVTEKAEAFLRRLKDEQHLFSEDKMAAKFGAAYAITQGFDAGMDEAPAIEGTTFNKWDSLSLDGDGSLRMVVISRHPNCKCPFRMIQYLLNRGLESMSDNSREGAPIEISKFM